MYDFVKTYDKDLSFAPEANPVLLNDDGTPRAFYYGTDAKFTEFNSDEMASREGSYFFAENRENAAASPMEKRKLAEYKAKIYGKIKKKSQWLRPSTFPDFDIKGFK